MPASAFEINRLLLKHQSGFKQVIRFNREKDHFIAFDFTEKNQDLTPVLVNDTSLFTEYINNKIIENNALFGFGGYFEHRNIYARSSIFDAELEPRRLHLGVDIWMPAQTPVFTFMDSTIHSFAFNNHFGDYGATIILSHKLEDIAFFSLYGHLSLKSIENLKSGDCIPADTNFAWLGKASENGNWPPHLHFQLVTDIADFDGDYPGVCKLSEKEYYQNRIPNPHYVLGF